MEFLALLAFAILGVYLVRQREQQRRIALLGRALGQYQIERLMENLTEGYLRWLDEQDPERRAQVWGVLQGTERSLADQFARFAADFSRLEAPLAQVSKLPFTPPFAQQWLPAYRLFDARRLFALHARGIEACASNAVGRPDKARAYMMTAELYLMQHSCHWFCRSKTVASARLLARHQTPYQQVLDSVSAGTRADYLALVS
jgi:hypothetical protein